MRNRDFVTRLFGLFLIGIGLSGSPWSLAQETAKLTDAASVPAATEVAPSAALIRQGQDLFLGTTRFGAGGPSCNSCHNVVHSAVVGGGTLAMDLTESFGRLGTDGIVETLPRKGAQSPFPLMQSAFEERNLSLEEGRALAAFLQHAHVQRATQPSNDLGSRMLLAGGIGGVVLLLLFSLIGRGRKRRCVNQDIYDRQVASE